MLIHLINRPKTVRLEFRKERLLENCCYTGNNVYGVIRNLITKLRPFLKEAKTMELIYLILKNLISKFVARFWLFLLKSNFVTKRHLSTVEQTCETHFVRIFKFSRTDKK